MRSEAAEMPYKDPEEKKKWESLHRSQRIARRRQLRQVEAAWKAAHPEATRQQGSGPAILLPIAAGVTVAAWSPPLAICAGLTVSVAALYKKGWSWWIVGLVILVAGLFFQWNESNQKNQTK